MRCSLLTVPVSGLLTVMKPDMDSHLLKANPDTEWTLPQEIVDKTIEKYLQAYKMLTGKDLDK